MTRTMMLRGRTAAADTELMLAGGLAASAQTTIITTQKATTGTVVPAPAQATVEYRVGTRVPEATHHYAVPQEVAVEVPSIRSYKYMVVNNRVLLVDPAPSQVVAELAN